jgi:hypothetical protein
MDPEIDAEESENPNWAYPLLRIVLTGALIEIICTTILWVLSWIGFVPSPFKPVVDVFVTGAIITGSWATGCFLLYLWIRPQLIKNSNP